MLFNSLDFFIFLPIVFLGHWILFKKTRNLQNIWLLLSSYVFYGWWDWRFLSLIVLSTIIDYLVGQQIFKTNSKKRKKVLLWVSILFNLGLLGFFKYYNFFITSFVDSFSFFGMKTSSVWTLNVILPVGISFYTFQTMSYSLDVYREKLKPTKSIIAFATFVSFFPQLVAGPIERAASLLPQIQRKRGFSKQKGTEGIKLILWGLFKKVAIADALAPMVDDIFSNAGNYPASTLILGAIFFGFQIYGDFSGYSDIAIGTAKLFGIELMSNFKFPYFSRNIAEFWRKWHISLSTWFRDYLYIPLGGSRTTKGLAVRNVFIIFLVSGFWHGANWTFIVWGGLHAALFVPFFITGNNRNYINTTLSNNTTIPSFKEVFQVLYTFFVVNLAWIFFRAESMSHATTYIQSIFLNFSFEWYEHPNGYRMIDYFILLSVFVMYEFRIRRDERNPFPFKSKMIRFLIYSILIFALMLFYDSGIDRSFIYFQF
ncbi:MAG: MBOAT family O-acyltransferase [Bacteroidota bacterium]